MKLRRVLALVMALCLLIGQLPATAWAAEETNVASGTCGENLTWILDASGVLTVSGTGAMYDYEADTTPWQNYAEQITTLVIEEGVTYLGVYAFAAQGNLREVSIAKSVTSIGSFAFQSCTSLTVLDIPVGVISIGNDAFSNCAGLMSVTIPNSVENIAGFAFSDCDTLSTVTIPDSVTDIGVCAFAYCDNLAGIWVDDNNTHYSSDSYGVMHNKDKTVLIQAPGALSGTYTVANSVTDIGSNAFGICRALTAITFPEGLASIGSSALSYCRGLVEITFTGDAPVISEDNIFENVEATVYYPADNATWTEDIMQNYGGTLTWSVLADSVETVDSGTCGENLTWTMDANGVLTVSGTGAMADSAFAGREDITEVILQEGVTSVGDDAFDSCFGLTSVTLPESLTTIGDRAFNNCDLTDIAIPESVASIGSTVFFGCGNLQRIDVAEGNANYSSDAAGVLFNKDKTTLIWAPGAMEGTYDIPASVTSLAVYAFHGCRKLTGITIPESVTTIGYNAFHLCTGLTSITIPGSVEKIPSRAFYLCSNLTSVTIMPGVTYIGSWAFSSCNGLTGITIPAGITEIDELAFAYSKNLTKVVFEGDAPTIWEEAFAEVQAEVYYPANNATWVGNTQGNYGGTLTWVAYEPPAEIVASGTCGENLTWTLDADGILTISGTGAMTDYAYDAESPWPQDVGQMAVVIEEGVTGIGIHAFYNNENITSVSIPSTVTTIGMRAFSNCSNLVSVNLPAGLTEMGDEAFCDCVSLSEVTVESGITTIGYRAFMGCTGLTAIELPETVSYISNSAFSGCRGLTEIVIPEAVTVIGANAFSCSGLKRVTIPANVVRIGEAAFQGCRDLQTVTICSGEAQYDSWVFSTCEALTEIVFLADAPAMTNNILNNVSATAYYPQSNATWTEETKLSYGGTITWVPYARTGTIGTSISWVQESNGTVTVFGYGPMKDYLAASSSPWYNNSSVKAVVIKEGITNIGTYAFFYCHSLSSVTIPNTVTRIGDSSFYGAWALESISIPESVTCIDDEAFYSCNLTELTIPGTVKTVGASAFYMNDFETVVIEEGVVSIGNGAFSECGNLRCATIPNSVTELGSSMFRYCSNLQTITLGDGVTAIPAAMAEYCEKLTSVTMRDGVTQIGASAFYECDSLRSIIIPAGVTSLGNRAFAYCSGLTEVLFLGNMPSFGTNVFYTDTAEVYYPADDTTWPQDSLKNYASTVNWVPVTDAGSCGDRLTWVLTREGTLLVYGTGGMASYSETSPAPWKGNAAVCQAEIRDGVTSVGAYAFSGCENLKTVLLADSVTGINACAFSESGLTGIMLPAAVAEIGSRAFGGCEYFREANFTGNAPAIAEDAFWGVTADMRYPGSDTTWTETVMQDYGGSLTWKAGASSGSCGTGLTWTLTNEGILTISGTGAMTDYSGTSPWSERTVIKEIILEAGITAIGDYAFYGCASVTSVTIPESVTDIGSHAFSGCQSLKKIVFPEAVTAIGEGTFADCRNLIVLAIPANVTAIGAGAFRGCDAVANVLFFGTAPAVGENAFQGVTANMYYSGSDTTWAEALLPYGGTLTWNAATSSGTCGDTVYWAVVEEVELTVFGIGEMKNYSTASTSCSPWYGSSTLTSVVIEEGVTSIGTCAFGSCSKLTSVTMGDSITSIGGSAFSFGYILKDVTLSANLREIGNSAFYYCRKLESISIPESVTVLGTSAFKDCIKLRVANLPAGLTAVPASIFEGCAWLSAPTIPAGVTSIGAAAFKECSFMTSIVIPDGVKQIGKEAFYGCENLRQIMIPDSVTTIGEAAFRVCRQMTEANIGAGVRSIGNYAFAACYDLTGIWVDESNTKYCNDAYGVLYNKSQTTLIQAPAALAAEYAVPSSVTAIGEYAFQSCTNLTVFAVPAGVTTLGNYAFRGCTGLTAVTVADTVTSFGYGVFQECSSLTDVQLPTGLTAISLYTFQDCTSLASVAIPGTVTSIANQAFYGCTSLESIVIPSSVTSVGNSTFRDCASLSEVIFWGGAVSIGTYTFRDCTVLQTVRFKGNAPTISSTSDTFYNVTATVYYPEGNETWTEEVMQQYGGTLTWVAYDPIFALSGASVSLGNSLDMNFFLESPNVDAGCYAVITRSYADGRENHAVTVPYSEWNALEDGTLYVTYANIAAKEMGDNISVVIYNAEGEAISTQWDDSVKAYAMRMLEKTEDAKLRTLLVDMLNYGAAAQSQFGYDTANLVNAGLTDEQKAFATASYETESNLISGTGRAGTSLTLKSRITLGFIFENTAIGTDYTGLYAIAAYTDHYGNEIETRIDMVKVFNANLGYVSVPGLAVADYGQAVTCTVYDAEGNILAWATDSMEGYAHRMKGSLPNIVEAIVKFGNSSYNYFH